MQYKVIFGVLLVDTSRKFRKNTRFGEKYIYQLPKILRCIYQSADDPPPSPAKNIPEMYASYWCLFLQIMYYFKPKSTYSIGRLFDPIGVQKCRIFKASVIFQSLDNLVSPGKWTFIVAGSRNTKKFPYYKKRISFLQDEYHHEKIIRFQLYVLSGWIPIVIFSNHFLGKSTYTTGRNPPPRFLPKPIG